MALDGSIARGRISPQPPLPPSNSLFLTHTHTHALTRARTHTHTHTHTHPHPHPRPRPLTITLTSTHTLTSTQCAMDSPIIGTLSKPLSIAVKTVPKDVMVSDAERYPLILQLSDVVVVENLPVPMHVSIHALAAANLAPRTAPPFQCIWEVCESPGLDGQAMEPGVLPAAYQKHKFWQSDDAAESSAIAAAQSAGFTAAASFEGARPGSVFKNGPIGLGYYLDAPPTPDPSVLVEVDKSADSGFLLPIALGVAAVVVAVVAAVILRRV